MLYEELLRRTTKLSVVGLGYVGLPLAAAFSRHVDVVGFDINAEKIRAYQAGEDPTQEIGAEVVRASHMIFTSDAAQLQEARFHIIAVPTPVDGDHMPDLTPIIQASETVGQHLQRGSIVVYESTVYPGVTEEICRPILERASGLKAGRDFKIGYSPERINPGDKKHRLENVVKIVSGMDAEALEEIANVYGLVALAGIHRAESIKVAEAAKVIENSQRDINIAFMNELAIIFHRMGIDTKAVLRAAGTKWNFLHFYPGLVGGHCIGVDPYYLTYKAEKMGYHSHIILAGRRINDSMGEYIAKNTVKKLIQADKNVQRACVAIFGFTFKENCQDTRNSKVYDIVKELREYGIEPVITDPAADQAEAERLYDVKLVPMETVKDMDALIFAVAHDAFKNYHAAELDRFYRSGRRVLMDVKGIFHRAEFSDPAYIYWRL